MSLNAQTEPDACESVQQATSQVEHAIESFTAVLQDLQESHARLEERAERVEAELCATNEELNRKVGELARVKLHLESVLTSIPTGVVVYDARGRITSANDAALSILGVESDAIIGAKDVEGLAGRGADGVPAEIIRADGVMRVLARRYSPIELDGGASAGGVEVIDDQSALVRAQERLHRLDKTAALGTMAGGVAHEIRNPLHGIQGFAELLIRETDGESRAAHFATRIREGVHEIEAIVSSMLGIAGAGGLNVEQFDVKGVTDEAVAAALREHSDAARWTVDVEGPSTTLRGDRIKIRQALRNLVANACDVQPDGGAVRIDIQTGTKGVTFVVSDAGPGIAPQDLHRLCDPFFTTLAEGTGLGLALVQRVAELHGGSFEPLTAGSRSGSPSGSLLGGAAFALTIPSQPA